MASPGPAAWYVISLRPQNDHAGLRRIAGRFGARVLALSPWRIEPCADPAARGLLGEALAARRVVFTSPAAVRAAAALQPLRPRPGQDWLAVGAGTAQALRRAGVAADAPARMDSEGLLALPALGGVAGQAVGLVTAPGGRGLIAETLVRRGARLVRADVYRRVPTPPSRGAVERLRRLDAPACLALSSGEALTSLLRQLPADAAEALRRHGVVAASPRLARLARDLGFQRIVEAAGPRPLQLVAAAALAGPGRNWS